MKPKNKIHLSFLMTLVLFLILIISDKGAQFLGNNSLRFGGVALADEDDEEEGDEDEEEDEDEDDARNVSSVESSPKTVTEIIRLPDQIITKTIMEIVYENDSDRDGLIDRNDPHPSIPEIYITKDENKNGISDDYEIL